MRILFIFSIISFLFLKNISAQEMYIMPTRYMPGADTVIIAKPTDADKTGLKYPVVVLLHGWSGSYMQWHKMVNIQKLADEYQFVVVCPDGFYDSWYVNSHKLSNVQFQKFFFDELMPAVFRSAPADDKNVFVSGLSMGGHGALLLFTQKPEFFRAAGSTSGVVDLTPVTSQFGIEKVLGDRAKFAAKYQENSVLENIDKLKGKNKEFLFDCGTSDAFFQLNEKLHAKCVELQLPHTYISMPGAHDAEYWKRSIHLQMAWFKQKVNK